MLPLNCSAPQGPVRWGSPRRRPFLSLSTSKGSGRETSRGSGRETSRGSGWESGRSSDTGSKRQSDSGRRPSGSGRFLVRNSRSYDAAPLTSDVSLLVHADDQLVTDVLCERYAERRVYTRCGADVLLLVTPSKPLDRYFDEAAKSKYRDGRLHELPPHIYLIAEEAYRRVRSMQAVVPIFVVGESGSGKTEAVKELVRYSLWRSSSETGASTSARLLNSIDASFLVLEAFGNARTLTSPNSSRFGLLRRLYVGQSGVHGASYRVYLFDRWRVLEPPVSEYNFHAFYSIVEGSPAALRDSIGLTIARGVRQFSCLVQGGGKGLEQVRSLSGARARDEAASFNGLYAALAELGLSDALRFGVLKLTVAVLHLNNVDAARMSIHGAARETLSAAPQRSFGSGDVLLRTVCSLLEIDSSKPGADLRESLFARSLQVRGERITIPHTAEQAEWCRAALARTLYELLFRWLVGVGNAEWAADADGERRARTIPAQPQALAWIEIYEMHGMEDTRSAKGLDTLGINLLSELMHLRFLEATFRAPAELCVEEGAPSLVPRSGPQPPFFDPAALLLLATLPEKGFLPQLDAICAKYGGDETDAAAKYASAVNQFHADGAFIRTPRSVAESETGFTVRHYCREASYNARELVARCNEALPVHIAAVLKRSNSVLLREMLQLNTFGIIDESATAAAAGNPGGKGPSLRQDTVGLTVQRRKEANSPPLLGFASFARRFEGELGALQDEIGRTHAAASLFVCCLKPAPIVHLASSCDRATVLRHVRARGLGAAAQYIGLGWSRVLEHSYLSNRFGAEIRKTRGLDWSTAATVLTGSSAVFAALLALAFEVPEANRFNGKRRLFLRGLRGIQLYSLCLSEDVEAVPVLKQALLDFARRRVALEKLGPWVLMHKERRRFLNVRRAATKLQAFARGQRARKLHASGRNSRGSNSRLYGGPNDPRRQVQRVASEVMVHCVELIDLSKRTISAGLNSFFNFAERQERKQMRRLSSMITGRRSSKGATAAAVLSGLASQLEKSARMNDIERRWQSVVEQMLARHRENSKDDQLMGTYLSRSGSRASNPSAHYTTSADVLGLRGEDDAARLDPLTLGRSQVAALEAELTMSNTTHLRREEIRAAIESASFRAGVREIGRYLLFLALFLAQIYQYKITDAYNVTAGLKRALHGRAALESNEVEFTSMDELSQVQSWLRGYLVPTIFTSSDASTDEVGSVLDVSHLVGAVRFAQDRGIVSTECVAPMYADEYIGVCYPGYATTDGMIGQVSSSRASVLQPGTSYPQSLERFGAGSARVRPEFSPSPVVEVNLARGERQTRLRFVRDIRRDARQEEVLSLLDELDKHSWFDEQTRTLDVLFTIYTPSPDVFTAVNFQVRWPYTGGVRGFAFYRPFVVDRHWLVFDAERAKLFPPLTADFAMLVCEAVFYLLVIYQYAGELAVLRAIGVKRYFRHGWSILELLNMTLFVATFALRVRLSQLVSTTEWAPSGGHYVDFFSVGDAKYTIQWFTAINCLLSFIKVFKYVTISPNLSVLNSTITIAADELASFVVLFLFIFLAFTQAFTIAFSSQLESCMDFGTSFVTLWLIVIGVFDFSQFQEISPVFGPLFFILFIIIIFFVFVNIFITIVTEAFKVVKENKRKKGDEGADPLAIILRNGLAKRFKVLSALSTEESAIDQVKKQLKKGEDSEGLGGTSVAAGTATVSRDGLKHALTSSAGGQIASLLGVEGGNEVDSIMRMFDSDNNGELDAEESMMLIDMIKKRAAAAAPKVEQEKVVALGMWPLVEPAPTPAQSRAMVSEHYARHTRRPLYAPGEMKLEERVEKLLEQSSALAHMVAENNTSTIKAVDELEVMLQLVHAHVAHDFTLVGQLGAAAGGLNAGVQALVSLGKRPEAPPLDTTLPLIPDRGGATAAAARRQAMGQGAGPS